MAKKVTRKAKEEESAKKKVKTKKAGTGTTKKVTKSTTKKATVKRIKPQDDGITCTMVAKKLGVTPKSLRVFLRDKFSHLRSGDYTIWSWDKWTDPELKEIMKAFKEREKERLSKSKQKDTPKPKKKAVKEKPKKEKPKKESPPKKKGNSGDSEKPKKKKIRRRKGGSL